ncbi:MAG: hypothetical protein MUE85_17345 [Microscillaceae bacterium]|nr:hypothetical protein [Microscillaceae bacterium]
MPQLEQDPFWLLTESMAQDAPTEGEGFVIAEAEDVLVWDEAWASSEADYDFYWENFKAKPEPVMTDFVPNPYDLKTESDSETLDIQAIINEAKIHLGEEPTEPSLDLKTESDSETLDIQAIINDAKIHLGEEPTEPSLDLKTESDSETLDIQAIINEAKTHLDEESPNPSDELVLANPSEMDDSEGWKIIQRILGETGETISNSNSIISGASEETQVTDNQVITDSDSNSLELTEETQVTDNQVI